MATADDDRIARPSPSLYDGSDLPRVRYLAAVTSHGFVHLAFDAIRGTIDAAAIGALGRGVVVHASPCERALAAFVWLPGELPCLIEAEYGVVRIEAAGHDADAARDALRALAGAWRDWCGVHYILDPHALMGADPRYLLDVLADDSGPPWRPVVLEDAGELIVHDASRTGALPTLLNLTDGILGHGTGTLVLVTMNEPVEHLHPAVRRRGRCLADLEFGPLATAEARAWLARAGCSAEVDEPHTLAELFALADGGEAADEPARVASPFGFGRALVRVTDGA